MRIAKEFRFEATHRLRRHEGACRNLHGHSYRLVVEVEGRRQLGGPATGMVLDFSTLSHCVRSVLEDDGQSVPFDHATILHVDDELTFSLQQHTARTGEDLRLVLLTEEPTAEYMAELFASLVQDNIDIAFEGAEEVPQVVRIELWETAKSRAIWDAYDTASDPGE